MLGTMLLFGFEGYETVTRRDFVLAWTPLITLDLSIFAFVAGLLLWYAEKTQGSEDKVFNSLASALFSMISWAAVRIWSILSTGAGLGKESGSS